MGKLNLWELASAGFAFERVEMRGVLITLPVDIRGGSGAAVAARMVPLALGTDTGGSVPNARGLVWHYRFAPDLRPRQPARHYRQHMEREMPPAPWQQTLKIRR